MRRFPIIAVLAVAMVWAEAPGSGFAQAQTQDSGSNSQQDAPDAPQPQAPAPKPQAGTKPSPGASSPSTAQPAGDNAFPEDVSQKAAQAAARDSNDADSGDSNSGSSGPAKSSSNSSSSDKSSSADANPFPEAVSRKAAKAAAADDSSSSSSNGSQLPPGANSNSSDSSDSNSAPSLAGVPGEAASGRKPVQVTDEGRAKKDNQVGTFYLQTGDYQGAYLRYKDAIAFDPGDTDAVFGMAEAARQLKHLDEAERNYLLYLQIVPDGKKAKDARKALNALLAPK